MLTITKEFKFEASHKLVDPLLSDEENKRIFGKCFCLHGHSYKLFVTIGLNNRILKNGMIMNFTDLKKIVNEEIIEKSDHCFLNEVDIYKYNLTTAENMVMIIVDILTKKLPEEIRLVKVKLYETISSYATWTRTCTNK